MLPPKLLDTLRDYWKRTHPGEWLFPGRQPGQPISASAVELAYREVRLLCGIGKPVAPHSLRHAFAVHLLERPHANRARPRARLKRGVLRPTVTSTD